MSNDERLRSLTLVHYMAIGCLRMVPRIESEEIPNLCVFLSWVRNLIIIFRLEFHRLHLTDRNVKLNIRSTRNNHVNTFLRDHDHHSYWKRFVFLEFRENLRMRLLIDIGKILGELTKRCYFVRRKWNDDHFRLDILVENHADDASSMKTALKVNDGTKFNIVFIDCLRRFIHYHRFITEFSNMIPINCTNILKQQKIRSSTNSTEKDNIHVSSWSNEWLCNAK